MSSREDLFENWRARAQEETPPATRAPFEAPEETTAPRPAATSEPIQRTARPPIRRTRPVFRKVKRTLRRIDPIDVLKLSLFFYSLFLVGWLVLIAIVFSVINSLGLFDTIEKFGQGFVLFEEVNITLGFVEKWALLIGLTLVVVGSFLNLVLAFLFNVASDLFGGVGLTFFERDEPPRT